MCGMKGQVLIGTVLILLSSVAQAQDLSDPGGIKGVIVSREGEQALPYATVTLPEVNRRVTADDGRAVVIGSNFVMPAEKLTIEVEGTAFRATQMTTSGDGKDRRIGLTLDSGDGLFVGPEHPLSLIETDHGPSPRVAACPTTTSVLTRIVPVATGTSSGARWTPSRPEGASWTATSTV